ncbi:hypothetical protein HRI_003148700 [Hibiscus trionum]|uniref:Uncharacterized protein n=1 Tax=Hibiscus trionum TaxID=183268 RepID=A0A9W7IEW9_HIBTR|nr:hypothetical protein HRI_003148700 [Hibiscus trionum]
MVGIPKSVSAMSVSATSFLVSSSRRSQKPSFRRRCLSTAKQQKTRFYILRRCVSMLLCWHLHSISD